MDIQLLSILLMLCITDSISLRCPEQIHLSFGDEHETMVVMWSIDIQIRCQVEYGESPDLLKYFARSNVSELPEWSFNALKYIHKAEVKNLKAGTRYYYRVVALDDTEHAVISSSVHSFTTLTNDTGIPHKYLLYGDLGANADFPIYRKLEEEVASNNYTAIWHVGDMAYDLTSDYGQTGDRFMQLIQPFAANISYMTSPGNHEIPGDFMHYRTRFSMPGIEWPMPLTKMWYSYDIGLVHFISYSTEVYFIYNEDYVCTQFYWLLDDLIKANQKRDKRPWIIAMGHRPMYCSNNNADDCTGRFISRWVKRGLERLFHAQGVDLIIEAHEHSYERLWPLYDEKVYATSYDNPQACVHVISGAAGNLEGVDWMRRRPEAWSAFRDDKTSQYSYGRLTIQNHTHLSFEQVSAQDNSLIDKFWLVQNAHGPFLKGVTCEGPKRHESCVCPPLIRYVYLIIGLALSFGIIFGMVVGIFGCFCCWRRSRALKRKGYVTLDLRNNIDYEH
ncbi:hypothetical protein CHS0354_026996 [Potamilus streckersoni]|uniref:Purple acid phosphatase n=1 Tax=Potamilus streckersoni TaxID=2493646 RepID=A0AAE0SCW0_9BIVA|nr:hypothetical protein CHS0354_026996 [Potamilus streckersoni]